MAGAANFNTSGDDTGGKPVAGAPSTNGDGYKGGKSVGSGPYGSDMAAAAAAGSKEHGVKNAIPNDRGMNCGSC